MINSVYGKAMENLRKRIDIRLVNNEKIFKNISPDHLTYHQTTITHKIIDKSYAAIDEIKPVLTLDNVGFTVPELSK